MSSDLLLQKLESLPVSPGCYIFRDKAGAVLYVAAALQVYFTCLAARLSASQLRLLPERGLTD